jgi:Ribosomal L29e protein family
MRFCTDTAHNQSYKAHRNGIKKPAKKPYPSRVGVRLSLLRAVSAGADGGGPWWRR